MHKISFTPFPELVTDRLVLRQISEEDLNEFYMLKSDERLLKGYDAKPRTFEQASSKLKELNEDITRNESITWGIALKNINKIIGSICFWNLSEEESKAEIGYELLFDWQGKGIMQEALSAVINYGFNAMELQSIEAVPNPNNRKSVNLLERNHFTRGPIFTECNPSDGKIFERVLYTLKNGQ